MRDLVAVQPQTGDFNWTADLYGELKSSISCKNCAACS
jgi:hypothetical protein